MFKHQYQITLLTNFNLQFLEGMLKENLYALLMLFWLGCKIKIQDQFLIT